MLRLAATLSTFFVAAVVMLTNLPLARAQQESLRDILLRTRPAPRDLERDLQERAFRPYENIRSYRLPRATENCQETEFDVIVRDPMHAQGSMPVTFLLYRPLKNLRQDSILIYPSILGVLPPERSYARKFCEAGFPSLIIKRWPHSQMSGMVTLESYDEVSIRGIHATHHAMDILRRLYPRTEFGLFGTSQGGISALAAGIFFAKQVKAVSTLVAALPFSQVLARSQEGVIQETREARMTQFGLTRETEYQQLLKKHIHVEPLNYLTDEARAIPHQFFVGSEDTSVPSQLQGNTVRIFSNAEPYYFPQGHLPTILAVYTFHQFRVVDFFLKHLR